MRWNYTMNRAKHTWTAFWTRWDGTVGVVMVMLAGVAIGMGIQSTANNVLVNRIETENQASRERLVEAYAQQIADLSARVRATSVQTAKASKTAEGAARTAQNAATTANNAVQKTDKKGHEQ